MADENSTQSEIEAKDVFETTDIESLRATLNDIIQRFGVHDHDGRNSLEINVLRNQKRLILATLNQISDKSDGNVTISGTTTLTRDMFYDHLIVESGGILNTASFRVFGTTVENKGGGTIRNNGSNGSAGTAGADSGTKGTGGAGGAVVASGSLSGGEDGKAGGDGGAGGNNGSGGGEDGVAGTAGDNVIKSLGAAGSGGGGGGNSSGSTGGAGGNGGSQIGTVLNVPRSFIAAYNLSDNGFPGNLPTINSITTTNDIATVTTASAHGLLTGDTVVISGANQTAYNGPWNIEYQTATTFTYNIDWGGSAPTTPATGTITGIGYPVIRPLLSSAGSGSGGGGGGGSRDAGATGGGGGGGGGSGSTGGIVAIFAKQIINNGTITATGGAGGAGGNGGNSSNGGAVGGAGGGGGGGGAGGVIILVYGDLSGAGTTSVVGGALGAAGSAGTPTAGSNDGSAGAVGTAGTLFSIQISSL